MIYINQSQQNDVPAVCSRNSTLTGTVYWLWSATHKLTLRSYKFVPYRIPPNTDYSPSYDLFNINVNDSIPESLTGNTISGTTNVHLIPGEYYVRCYQQTTNSNLNPLLSDGVVWESMMTCVGDNQNEPITYSGQSDVFIVYNENND